MMKFYNLHLLLSLYPMTFHAEGFFVGAHRGSSKDAPENTIPAFELAWKNGAHGIEG